MAKFGADKNKNLLFYVNFLLQIIFPLDAARNQKDSLVYRNESLEASFIFTELFLITCPVKTIINEIAIVVSMNITGPENANLDDILRI